jgi:hypothetical protein
VRLRHDVEKATWSGDEKVATLEQLGQLLTNWSTTICHARAKHGSIAETSSFIEDLAAELSSRSNDQNKGLGTNAITLSVEAVGEVRTGSSQLLGLAHKLGETGNQEGCSLPGTCGRVRRIR